MTALVLEQIENRICTLSLNRPDKRNALSPALIAELKIKINNALQNEGVRVLILEGKGKSFSAGADLQYISDIRNNSFEENLADSKSLQELYDLIYRGSKPVIAKVTGHALAGGCGLASICDFTFATPLSKFGYTETKIGFVPALVSVYLQGLVPHRKLREWLLSGAIFTAEEAQKNYLINEVIDESNIDDYVSEFALNLIKSNSGDSIALTKQLLAETTGKELDAALQNAAEMNAKARTSKDCIKGIDSFLNKDKIEW